MAPQVDDGGVEPRRGWGRSSRSTGYRARSYYLPDALHFRLRDAWWATHELEGGHDTASSAVATAIEFLVADLERTHNQGRSFPPMPEGSRPPGAGAKGRARQAQAIRDLARSRRDDDAPTEA